MNEVSIIINGVRYDAVEENGSSCRQCDLLKVCHDYRICRAFSLTGKTLFKKSDVCECHKVDFNGWTEITPDNVDELYNIPEDLLIVAFKLGDTIYYQRNKDMRPTLNTLAKTGGYYYYVLPELKIE